MCHSYPVVSNIELVFPWSCGTVLYGVSLMTKRYTLCTPAPAFSYLSEFNVPLLQYFLTVGALFLDRAIPLNPLILQYLAPILFSFVLPA